MIKITNLFSIIMLTLFTAGLQANENTTMDKNVVIIFDDSGSMGGGKTNSKSSKMIRAKKATKAFISELPNGYNLGIYALNSGYIFNLQSLTDTKKKKAISVISNLISKGKTPIGSSLVYASNVLLKQRKQQAGYGDFTIVIVTDGAADNSLYMLREVDNTINNNIAIKTIGLDIRYHKLQDVTDFTQASSVEQLTVAMKKAINAEIDLMSSFEPQDF